MATNRFWTFVEHPRVRFIGALVLTAVGFFAPHILGYVLFGLAGLLVVNSVWQWRPLHDRVPLDFQSPVVMRNRVPRPRAVAAELGRVDFELNIERAANALAKRLEALGNEMERGGAQIEGSAQRLNRAQNKSVRKRHRALRRSARVVTRHAKRLERIEGKTRVVVGEFVSNSKSLIEMASPDEDLAGLAESTDTMRTAALNGNQGTGTYQATVVGVRSQNVSQATNAACDRLSAVLGRVMDNGNTIVGYCDEVARIVAARTTSGG